MTRSCIGHPGRTQILALFEGEEGEYERTEQDCSYDMCNGDNEVVECIVFDLDKTEVIRFRARENTAHKAGQKPDQDM